MPEPTPETTIDTTSGPTPWRSATAGVPARQESDPGALVELRAAGFPLEDLTDEQLSVLAGLGAEELSLLIDIKARLDAVEPEVQAHVTVAGAGLF